MEDIAWYTAAVLFLAILLQQDARATEPLPEAQQCAYMSRYALIARSLSEARVGKEKARSVLARIYRTDNGGERLAELILDHAYRKTNLPADTFADQLEFACMAHHRKDGYTMDGTVISQPGHRRVVM